VIYNSGMTKKSKEFLERQAKRKDMTPREYCIYRIEAWRKNLEKVSEDYRELSDSEYQKKIDEEIMERQE